MTLRRNKARRSERVERSGGTGNWRPQFMALLSPWRSCSITVHLRASPGNDLTYIVQAAPGVVMNTDVQGGANFSILGMPGFSVVRRSQQFRYWPAEASQRLMRMRSLG